MTPEIEAVILGNAQDGGLPQLGCNCPNCRRGRSDPAERRFATSLALVDRRAGETYLIDASPDIREQLELLDRLHAPPLSGVLLTHAHMGHYAGLLHLGREAMAVRELPLLATEQMVAFLSREAPWRLSIEERHLVPRPIPVDDRIELTAGLAITAVPVPHRGEYSDTVCFAVDGPSRRLLHLPDIDAWDRFDPPGGLQPFLRSFDEVLVDGTFFSSEELPGRDLSLIPHPFVTDSIGRFGHGRLGATRLRFVHLNHSNPAHDPDHPSRRAIEAAGLEVAVQGARLPLSRLDSTSDA